MMGGFRNYLATKLGTLTVAALRSANYAAGSAGWQISKDGSAELNDATVRGTVTGSVFDGTDFEINSDGAFFYDGTPAAGNLLLAITNPSASGTDSHGNTYAAGGISVISLADLANMLSLQDTSGNTLAAIDQSGNVTGQTLTANSDLYIAGESWNNDINPNLPQGVIAYAAIPDGDLPTAATTGMWILELDCQVPGQRLYKITLGQVYMLLAGGPYMGRVTCYYTDDGTQPSTSSSIMGIARGNSAAGYYRIDPTMVAYYQANGAADITLRLRLRLDCSSATTVQIVGDAHQSSCQLFVEDIGVNIAQTGEVQASGSTSGGTQNYTKTYTATNTHCYQGSDGHQPNALIASGTNPTQGGDYADTYNGKTKSWIVFPHSTIQSDLSGATVNWVKLKLANEHSWYNSGMTVCAGYDTKTSFGSTASDPSGSTYDLVEYSQSEGQTLTYKIDSSGSTFGAAFKAGNAYNIVLWKNSNSLAYYGYFDGTSQGTPPQLIINYTK